MVGITAASAGCASQPNQPVPGPSGTASPLVEQPPASVPSPTETDIVALCPYDDGSGVLKNVPCDAPELRTTPAASPASAGDITCETRCTNSGCEQYQLSVLGCQQ